MIRGARGRRGRYDLSGAQTHCQPRVGEDIVEAQPGGAGRACGIGIAGVLGMETFVRVQDSTGAPVPEDDVFAGLR